MQIAVPRCGSVLGCSFTDADYETHTLIASDDRHSTFYTLNGKVSVLSQCNALYCTALCTRSVFSHSAMHCTALCYVQGQCSLTVHCTALHGTALCTVSSSTVMCLATTYHIGHFAVTVCRLQLALMFELMSVSLCVCVCVCAFTFI